MYMYTYIYIYIYIYIHIYIYIDIYIERASARECVRERASRLLQSAASTEVHTTPDVCFLHVPFGIL